MRRLLKWVLIALVVVLLPFGVFMMAIPLAIASTIAKVDSDWKPAASVIGWARIWCAAYKVPFNFALSILYNEGASTPRELRSRELQALGIDGPAVGYPVGDLDSSRGPSVGPGQVLRSNVERLWLAPTPVWIHKAITAPRAQDLALVGNERKALWAAVKMMREVLDQSNDDLWEAAKRYNGGGGNDPRALAYADRAQATLERIG